MNFAMDTSDLEPLAVHHLLIHSQRLVKINRDFIIRLEMYLMINISILPPSNPEAQQAADTP